MFKTLINAWNVKDIRTKMLYTLLLVVIYRFGSFIPVPGVDASKIAAAADTYSILSFLNLLSGGNFGQFTIFAMGITPYITGSIIIQLLTIAIPSLEKMAKEEDGREKLERITRYTGIGLALVQSIGIVSGLQNQAQIVTNPGFLSYATIGIVCTAGTAFLVWLGERITEKGIGNGISFIIFASIVSSVPQVIVSMVSNVMLGTYKWWILPVLIVFVLIMVAGVVAVDRAVRRIPVQYAKRVVGRKMYGGQSTFLPVKVAMSGVMPVIFASAILSIPQFIQFFWNPSEGFGRALLNAFSSSGWLYVVLYFFLILMFAYFYMSIQYNPLEMANNLRQNNGTIPGIRPGKPTADFIAKILSKVTLIGALFLAFVALVPIIYTNVTGMYGLSMGGTSIIIIVGVALETVKQLESQMMLRHYKGFLD